MVSGHCWVGGWSVTFALAWGLPLWWGQWALWKLVVGSENLWALLWAAWSWLALTCSSTRRNSWHSWTSLCFLVFCYSCWAGRDPRILPWIWMNPCPSLCRSLCCSLYCSLRRFLCRSPCCPPYRTLCRSWQLGYLWSSPFHPSPCPDGRKCSHAPAVRERSGGLATGGLATNPGCTRRQWWWRWDWSSASR